MPRKESEAVPEGNDSVLSKKNSGLANPRWRMDIEWLKKSSINLTGDWKSFRMRGEGWIGV